jgi:hypothetical protein
MRDGVVAFQGDDLRSPVSPRCQSHAQSECTTKRMRGEPNRGKPFRAPPTTATRQAEGASRLAGGQTGPDHPGRPRFYVLPRAAPFDSVRRALLTNADCLPEELKTIFDKGAFARWHRTRKELLETGHLADRA